MMKEFLNYLLGDMSAALFAAAVFVAFIGAIVGVLIGTSYRDKDSMRTPLKFSWSFMFNDNKQRIVTNLLLILVAIRFCDSVFGVTIDGDNLQFALFIGLSLDKIPEALRNKNIIDKK